MRNGEAAYDAATSELHVDLEFLAGGVAYRITNHVADGVADTVAMSYRSSGTNVTVISPGSTVTYGYSLSDDGSRLTFTNLEAGHVLFLEKHSS